jgi:ferredoxin-NADP reductase
MSARFEVRFLELQMCGSDIATFRFERPSNFDFTPGQWLRLALPTVEGEVTETFSVSSAPSDRFLEITTRLSGSAFKNSLAALEPQATVKVTGPGGRLSLPEGLESVAFLVGGVGITPVRSMLREAAFRRRRFDDALLLYGNRDQTCVPFAEEFAAMSDLGVRTVLCFEHPGPGWSGETGFITAETVRRHLDPGVDDRPFFVTGPPVMVAAMERVLDDLGVDASRRTIERFGPKS